MNADFSPKGVLTVDIVGFSLFTDIEQLRVIHKFIELLHLAIPKTEDHPNRRVWSPSGDGGVITFWENIYATYATAIELAKRVAEHNGNPQGAPPFQVRIGLHSGTVTREVDFDNRENVWGEGINFSARVANLAQSKQILASEEFCKQTDLYRRTSPDVTYIGKWRVKHDKFISLYNVYMDGAGIPPSEVDAWFRPFYYPLQQAIEMYEAMLEEEVLNGDARHKVIRVAALCKRLTDLQPGHLRAQQVLESISRRRHRQTSDPILSHPFFSELSPRALRYFFENARFKDFKKEETIVEEGAQADSMMIVISGEIAPSIRGNRILRRQEVQPGEQPEAGEELIFSEGDIIGEMGLFSEGQKRTATLTALRNSTTLVLAYDHLKMPATDSMVTLTPDDLARSEIINQIWKLNCQRIIQNQIYSHPLTQKLPTAAQSTLTDYGEFYPADYRQAVQIKVGDVWQYWTFVVAGNVTAFSSDKQIGYHAGDCLGPIRLVMPGNPFSKIETSSDSQIIRFPWAIVKAVLNDPATPEEFRSACKATGERDRAYLQ